jgi:glucosamine--fructose-6-phosphate aminotransferase (isomerizing)
VIFLNDGEIATVTNNSIQIIDHQKNVIEKEVKKVEWSLEDAQKGGFSHFMLKEIYEQPDTIHKTFLGRFSEIEPSINFGDIGLSEDELVSIGHITILACGTSYYAGMIGKYIIEKMCSIPVNVEISSEYFSLFNAKNDTLFIAITQSGETADTLSSIRKIKVVGCKTLAITNVPDSTITRLTHGTIYTRAGPEIGVAATKTFTSQIVVLYLFALYIGLIKGIIGPDKARKFIKTIKHLPRLVQSLIDDTEIVKRLTRYLDAASSVFFVGRNINYPVSLEGALKLKEISYLHAEGFAAGELKHGPFALLTKHTPVFAIIVKDETYDKMLGNIGEIKARYAPVIAIADMDDEDIEKYVDEVVRIPSISPEFSPILVTVLYQLLAYHTANKKGYSIDKPRNLAKSVTVE